MFRSRSKQRAEQAAADAKASPQPAAGASASEQPVATDPERARYPLPTASASPTGKGASSPVRGKLDPDEWRALEDVILHHPTATTTDTLSSSSDLTHSGYDEDDLDDIDDLDEFGVIGRPPLGSVLPEAQVEQLWQNLEQAQRSKFIELGVGVNQEDWVRAWDEIEQRALTSFRRNDTPAAVVRPPGSASSSLRSASHHARRATSPRSRGSDDSQHSPRESYRMFRQNSRTLASPVSPDGSRSSESRRRRGNAVQRFHSFGAGVGTGSTSSGRRRSSSASDPSARPQLSPRSSHGSIRRATRSPKTPVATSRSAAATTSDDGFSVPTRTKRSSSRSQPPPQRRKGRGGGHGAAATSSVAASAAAAKRARPILNSPKPRHAARELPSSWAQQQQDDRGVEDPSFNAERAAAATVEQPPSFEVPSSPTAGPSRKTASAPATPHGGGVVRTTSGTSASQRRMVESSFAKLLSSRAARKASIPAEMILHEDEAGEEEEARNRKQRQEMLGQLKAEAKRRLDNGLARVSTEQHLQLARHLAEKASARSGISSPSAMSPRSPTRRVVSPTHESEHGGDAAPDSGKAPRSRSQPKPLPPRTSLDSAGSSGGEFASPPSRGRRGSVTQAPSIGSPQSSLSRMIGRTRSRAYSAPNPPPRFVTQAPTPQGLPKQSTTLTRRLSNLLHRATDKPAPASSTPTGTLTRSGSGRISSLIEVREHDDLVVLVDEENPNATPIVRAGSLARLVARLTSARYTDMGFTAAFMLTYRSFATPLELLEAVVARFHVQPTPQQAETDERLADFKSRIQAPIQVRCVNVLKLWLEKHFYDFQANDALVEAFRDFVQNTMAESRFKKAAEGLLRSLQRKLDGEVRVAMIVTTEKPPMPHIPPNVDLSLCRLLDLHPEEIARQMTLIEYDLFRAIKPTECLNQSWSKKGKDVKAPNILAMIRRFNSVSSWVATEVLMQETSKQRAVVINRFIAVAEYSRTLNNFNAVMEILAGLQHPAVFRMRHTWKLLSGRMLEVFYSLRELMALEPNYHNFRETLRLVNPPCIPYLGVFLSDLTFIEDGNPHTWDYPLPTGGCVTLINFSKRLLLSKVISELQTYQLTPYNLTPVAPITEYLLDGCLKLPENDLFTLSQQREPRKKKSRQARPRLLFG